MKINNVFKLIIAIVVSELAGIIGSVFTTPSTAGWYAGIVKPALNPPAWVFGPVWTTLFALMGMAAFLVWSSYAEVSEDKKKGGFRGGPRKLAVQVRGKNFCPPAFSPPRRQASAPPYFFVFRFAKCAAKAVCA